MDAFQTFLEQYPAYADTASIDALRTKDYARLDRGRHVYLDYTGGGIYADSQIQQHHQLLHDHVFGNPHSSNPTSLAATQLVESARSSILDFFNADPDQISRHLHRQRQRSVKARRRALSIFQRALSAHL